MMLLIFGDVYEYAVTESDVTLIYSTKQISTVGINTDTTIIVVTFHCSIDKHNPGIDRAPGRLIPPQSAGHPRMQHRCLVRGTLVF